ncbi:MAG: VanZ family protein [Acidobacteria bacterium]|nr:VanZ family protein [Acidobacteriota bacterium]MBA4185309.1 VanZ family protein [Acidobacteriota bacterium]
MSARIKIITVIYIFILTGIVVLADVRQTQFLFNFIRSLPFGDKIGHFFLMGIFSLLVNLALSAKTIRLWKFKYLLGSLIVSAIVTLEEFSQIFVSGRTFDAGDLTVDFAGIVIFGEIARFLLGRFNRS